MRVLVTGAAGFLGSHLVERLLQQGHELVGLDNFYTGNRDNLAHVLGKIEFIEHDIREPLELTGIDRVYHLACPASPVHYQRDPLFTMDTSIYGIKNILEICVRNSADLIFASTSEVYGNPQEHPQSEQYLGNVNTTGPRSCYDEGKRAAETYCYIYHQMRGVKVKIARIFNTYGPRMSVNDGRVVSNFITQALNGEDLTVFGDGKQTRSFCYVDDLIDGLLLLGQKTIDFVVVNLGNDDEFRVIELAEMVIKLTNSKSQIRFLPALQDDPSQRKPDISRARHMLGWSPKIDLPTGLKKTIDYFIKVCGKNV